MRLRDGAAYIASKVVSGALGLATATLLTWLLAPESYGIYGLGLTVITVGNNVLFDWMSVSFQRWYQGHANDPAFMATLLLMFGGVCAASAVLMETVTLLGLLGQYQRYAWLFLGGAWAYGWFEFTSRIQVGRFRPARYFWMCFTRNALILASSAAVGHFTGSAEMVLGVTFASMFVAGSLYLGDGSISLRGRFDKALARSFVVYATPIGVTMILYGLGASINRVMLGALLTVEAVAHYTVASTLVHNSLGLISTGIGMAGFTTAIRAVDSGDHATAQSLLRRNYIFLAGLLFPAGVGLTLVSHELCGILISPQFRDPAEQVIPWLALYSVLIGLRAQYIDTSFQLGKRTGLAVQVTALSAAVNLGLNLLLIPRWGLVGSTVALNVAGAISFAHATFLAKRCYALPIPVHETVQLAAATGFMALVIMVVRPLPGIGGLLAEVVLGIAAYAVALATLDIQGSRHLIRQYFSRIALYTR